MFLLVKVSIRHTVHVFGWAAIRHLLYAAYSHLSGLCWSFSPAFLLRWGGYFQVIKFDSLFLLYRVFVSLIAKVFHPGVSFIPFSSRAPRLDEQLSTGPKLRSIFKKAWFNCASVFVSHFSPCTRRCRRLYAQY